MEKRNLPGHSAREAASIGGELTERLIRRPGAGGGGGGGRHRRGGGLAETCDELPDERHRPG